MHRSLPLTLSLFLAALVGFSLAPQAVAQSDGPEANHEAEVAIERFRIPDWAQVTLWAAEPLMANPVSFDVDHRGRVFVAETYRQETEGVPDNRSHRYWIDDDLRLQTVEERGAMYLKHHPEYAQEWTEHTDRIVRLVDEDGDGRADQSQVFATDFNDLLDGTGAGVLVRGDEAWFTCIPKLWKLTDADDDGVSEKRESLHHGYGVRVALRGHDLHGLVVGPDGRLYFSVGDRGYNVQTQEGETLLDPGSGAVFRCDLDGSNLEVFATGLRNPQELAFDEYGNLFTGDNNCDAGDAARVVYVMEGGDCGWSMNFQYLPDRGPWMPENWWKPRFEGQAAFVNAPIANLAAGPSGLAYYPGVGMPAAMQGSFFLVDFRGGAGGSGVLRFTVKPDGAGFDLDQSEEFWWGVLATDVAFGPDGDLYLSDWVAGWTGAGKGRIYRMGFDEPDQKAEIELTQRVLGEGMQGRGVTELVDLLYRKDYRVRLEAQLQLVQLGEIAVEPLIKVLASQENQKARMHAIWALGSLGLTEHLLTVLEDKDPEIRAQAARTLGEGTQEHGPALVALLKDPHPRVAYHAAQSLGSLQYADAVVPLFEVLRRNADKDRFLRHAAAFALSQVADARTLSRAFADPSSSAVLGAVLALRHQNSPALAPFVAHADPYVATEAAIAIYDRNVNAALPALVERLRVEPAGLPDALARRALHAANRLGALEPIVAYANQPGNSEKLRKEAAGLIAAWLTPKEFDAMRNESRVFPPRAENPAIAKLLEQTKGAQLPELRTALAQLAGSVGGEAMGQLLFDLLQTEGEAEATRIACVQGLKRLQSNLLEPALDIAWRSDEPKLRSLADRLWRQLRPDSLPDMTRVLAAGSPAEQAEWFGILAERNAKEADDLLAQAMDSFPQGQVAPAAQLELIEAVQARGAAGSSTLEAKYKHWQGEMDSAGAFERFRISLSGGDAETGRQLFFENATAGCFRCHAIDGQDGVPSEVGPNMSSVGLLRTPEELLSSILQPNKEISAGYEMYDAKGKLIPVSAMLPNYSKDLSPREIRDLRAYLETLRKPEKLAVYVHSAGFEHAVAKREGNQPSLVESQWAAWAAADPRFEVVRVTDAQWFESDELNQVDAVFFYTTGTLPLSASGREALQKFVDGGGGFVGAHCATDTFMDWPWYGEMVGGYFNGHPWDSNSEVSVRAEDPTHSTCKHLPNPWKITDEIYQFKEPYDRKNLHVVLSLDPEGTDMTRKGMARSDGDYPVAWTKRQLKGKVFYTSLGHRADVWTNDAYRQHLVEGLLWAAK